MSSTWRSATAGASTCRAPWGRARPSPSRCRQRGCARHRRVEPARSAAHAQVQHQAFLAVVQAPDIGLERPLREVHALVQAGLALGRGDQAAAVGAPAVARAHQLQTAVVAQRGDLRLRQAVGQHAAVGGHQLGNAPRDRPVAATEVEQWQPQGHQQQPAQRAACGRQHQAFPDGLAVAAHAPRHQPQPGQCGRRAEREQQEGELGHEARGQPRHVGRRLGRHPGHHGHPDDPDDQGAEREEQQGEPVNQRGHAAPQRGQGKGGEHGQRRQGEQQGAVALGRQRRMRHHHQGSPQRQRDMGLAPLAAPPPQRPQRQWPRGPGEPQQQTPPTVQRQAGQGLRRVGWAQGAGPAAAQRDERAHGRGDAQQGAPAVARGFGGRRLGCQPQQAQPAGAQHQPQAGRPAEGQGQPAGRPPRQAAPGMRQAGVGQAGGAQQHGRRGGQAQYVGGGLVRELGESQAGDQGQQAGIGQGARVVGGVGLAAEGEGHRLRCWLTGQVVHRVPSARQREGQQPGEGKTGREIEWQKGQGADEQRAQPVGQQRGVFHRQAQHAGVPPVPPPGQLRHRTEGAYIGVLPGRAAQKAGQHIGHAEQDEGQARQSAHGRLAHDGGRRAIHGWGLYKRRTGGKRRAREDSGKKKAAGLRLLSWASARITWRSWRSGCGISRRGRPCCPRSSACRCRTGAIRWRYRA